MTMEQSEERKRKRKAAHNDANNTSPNSSPSLASLSHQNLCHIFGFAFSPGDPSLLQMGILCKSFHRLIEQDKEEIYPPACIQFEFDVKSMKEKLCITKAIRRVRKFKSSTRNLICTYIGGNAGVRTLIDKMLIKMERGKNFPNPIIQPYRYPANGFKLHLTDDSIGYLTEVIEQDLVDRLDKAMAAALFRSQPPSSHHYPMVCKKDLLHVESMSRSTCCIPQGREFSLGPLPKMWHFDGMHHYFLDEVDNIMTAEMRQQMVRAIAYRAGVVKLDREMVDVIALQIFKSIATIAILSFEESKSLWNHHSNYAFYISGIEPQNAAINDDVDESDSEVGSQSNNSFFKKPPLPRECEEGGLLHCTIVACQIKDAAVRIGLKPLLGGDWNNDDDSTYEPGDNDDDSSDGDHEPDGNISNLDNGAEIVDLT